MEVNDGGGASGKTYQTIYDEHSQLFLLKTRSAITISQFRSRKTVYLLNTRKKRVNINHAKYIPKKKRLNKINYNSLYMEAEKTPLSIYTTTIVLDLLNDAYF